MTTSLLTDRFPAALQLAEAWHRGQHRKGTSTPYISHLLGVASIALEFGADEDEAVAALLHDALEDGPTYTGRSAGDLKADIEARFGARVRALVEGATDAEPEAGQPKAPWAERKNEYLGRLGHEAASSLLVSASDKLHNARAILVDVLGTPASERAAYFDRFNQKQAGTLQYYRLLVDHYRAAPGGQEQPRLQALFAELERTVSALEAACGVSAEQVRAYPLLKDSALPTSSA